MTTPTEEQITALIDEHANEGWTSAFDDQSLRALAEISLTLDVPFSPVATTGLLLTLVRRVAALETR